ncbi:MAG: universal stress protein [Geobacter sp.]|nr:MAG: universal stress protein [Geobacter sp.]
MENIKKILVVIRLTQNSRDALSHGVALAKQFGAELSVIRVYSNPVDMEAVNAPGLFIKGEQYKNYLSIREQYKEYLDKAIHEVTKDGFPLKEFITDKDAITEIASVVEKEKIDLIVTLAHEEGRLEHLLFGGENVALIRKLPCSILLVKQEPGPA